MNVQNIRVEVAVGMVILLVGVWLGYFLANRTIRNNAIQQECAHYDSKTGDFTWGQVQ